jgi:hypothetical protein
MVAATYCAARVWGDHHRWGGGPPAGASDAVSSPDAVFCADKLLVTLARHRGWFGLTCASPEGRVGPDMLCGVLRAALCAQRIASTCTLVNNIAQIIAKLCSVVVYVASTQIIRSANSCSNNFLPYRSWGSFVQVSLVGRMEPE